jgi:hypothetical protein
MQLANPHDRAIPAERNANIPAERNANIPATRSALGHPGDGALTAHTFPHVSIGLPGGAAGVLAARVHLGHLRVSYCGDDFGDELGGILACLHARLRESRALGPVDRVTLACDFNVSDDGDDWEGEE